MSKFTVAEAVGNLNVRGWDKATTALYDEIKALKARLAEADTLIGIAALLLQDDPRDDARYWFERRDRYSVAADSADAAHKVTTADEARALGQQILNLPRLQSLAQGWIQQARNNGEGHKESCAWELLEIIGAAETVSAGEVTK